MRSKPFRVFRYSSLTLILGLLALAGCGGGENLVDVKGKIYHGDQPLKSTGLDQAIVQFHSSEGKIYQGIFNEAGNYLVKAPLGKYKVLVIATKVPKGKGGPGNADEYAPPESIISPVYSDLKTTNKNVEVAADAKPGDYDIKLAKAK